MNRLRDALAPMPSAQAVGAACRMSGSMKACTRTWRIDCACSEGVRVQYDVAPVVDLGCPSQRKCWDRGVQDRRAEVTLPTREVSRGACAQGVVGCGKHFPGLGGGVVDTHFVTPEIRRSWQKIWDEDLAPYRELHRAMPMIMMNHAAYPRTPGKNQPASASAFWITKMLRKRIGYGD